VIISAAVTPTQWPDEQLKDFKIILPGDDEIEVPAEFQGRDERSGLSVLKATETRQWTPLKFEDVAVEVGDPIISVGLLPKEAGYKAYLMTSSVAAVLRGPIPQVLVGNGGLAAVGSPAFTASGQAIGFVPLQGGLSPLLGGQRNSLGAVENPPNVFIPARDFLISLSDPPMPASPLKIPSIGVGQLSGLKKEVAEYFEIKGQPAFQIGDVIPGFPADKAGLKPRDIVVKVNGQALERGDEPDETHAILVRKIMRMKIGDAVTFSVLREKGQPLTDVKVTLEERPMQANKAKRFFAEDLGFTSRQLVFEDTYARKLPADTRGVVVALIKPNSSAQSARLADRDLITKLNQTTVEDLDQFKTQYEAFRKEHPREAVVLEVLRGVNTQVVRIEPPQ
jgi:S1-C subfamily serine protease